MAAPQLGSVHAVYFDPTAVEMPLGRSTPSHPTWLRGRVIGVRQTATQPLEVVVLAVDHGFVFTAAMTQLRPLPHACQGIIHQVRLRGGEDIRLLFPHFIPLPSPPVYYLWL